MPLLILFTLWQRVAGGKIDIANMKTSSTNPLPNQPSTRRFQCIDFLRGVAALRMIYQHTIYFCGYGSGKYQLECHESHFHPFLFKANWPRRDRHLYLSPIERLWEEPSIAIGKKSNDNARKSCSHKLKHANFLPCSTLNT